MSLKNISGNIFFLLKNRYEITIQTWLTFTKNVRVFSLWFLRHTLPYILFSDLRIFLKISIAFNSCWTIQKKHYVKRTEIFEKLIWKTQPRGRSRWKVIGAVTGREYPDFTNKLNFRICVLFGKRTLISTII